VTRTREYLRDQLAGKLQRYQVVVWADPHHEYEDVVTELIPEGATFERFSGSWYELRRRIEPNLARLEPQLIVYVNDEEPEENPLAELRSVGTEFKIRLNHLLKTTLASEIAANRLNEISRVAKSLGEAEALVEGGGGGGPAQLVKVLRLHEPTDLILELARNGNTILEEHPELRDEVAGFAETAFGAHTADSDTEGAICRHLVVVELATVLGGLPATLQNLASPLNSEQRRRCRVALERWRNDQTQRNTFNTAMRQVDHELGLGDELPWNDALTSLDTVPAYDALAFRESIVRIIAGRYREAEELSAARARTRWAIGNEVNEWNQRWEVTLAVARLRRLVSDWRKPGRSVAELLRSYGDTDWQIDRAHRRLELALLALTSREEVEEVVRGARQAYDSWLDQYLRSTTTALEVEGLSTGDLLLQGQIHSEVVAPRAQQGLVGYFMVDALRYELGQELVGALRRQFEGGDIDIAPAIGLLPSLTPVGMANLCPGAERGLQLSLDDGDRLIVRIDGQEVMKPQQRVSRLQAAHGQVTDFRLDDIHRCTDNEIAERLVGASLVLVRSQEIDEQGETGKLNVGLNAFEATVRDLSRAVARLSHHGVTQFVISADHGFLALTREVGDHMIIPKPGGRGEVHRRAFIGKGGAASEALLRLPLDRIGLPGDLDVVVPRGLALIAAGGARGFFHGGLSPQEVVVPVVTVRVPTAVGTTMITVEVQIARKITSQIFTAQVLLGHSLLSEPLTVRPVAVRVSDGEQVSAIATAGGAEQGEGLVRLKPGEPVILGFRVTRSLAKNDRIELKVFDARTDRQRGVSEKPATVTRRLEVEDELP
jgi:hypothetical protein